MLVSILFYFLFFFFIKIAATEISFTNSWDFGQLLEFLILYIWWWNLISLNHPDFHTDNIRSWITIFRNRCYF